MGRPLQEVGLNWSISARVRLTLKVLISNFPPNPQSNALSNARNSVEVGSFDDNANS